MQHTLTTDNPHFRPCVACKRAHAWIWRDPRQYCYDCDAASRPVTLDGATIAAALNPPEGKPVVTARTAIEMLERSVGGRA